MICVMSPFKTTEIKIHKTGCNPDDFTESWESFTAPTLGMTSWEYHRRRCFQMRMKLIQLNVTHNPTRHLHTESISASSTQNNLLSWTVLCFPSGKLWPAVPMATFLFPVWMCVCVVKKKKEEKQKERVRYSKWCCVKVQIRTPSS